VDYGFADNISCCGKDCYACMHFPHDCVGCNEVGGRVFWLEYVDEVICSVYNCCRNKQDFYDCGECHKRPCKRYDGETDDDAAEIALPTVTPLRIDIKI
jgi:hypothetical protein